MFDRQRPQRPQMYNFRQRPSSLSQMEIRQNPSENTRFSPSRNGNLPPATASGSTSGTPSGGGEGNNSNGLPPYWLNPLYLAAILQQNNNQPNYAPSSPAAVSTSCGPNGCSAAAAAGSASSTSSSSGMFRIQLNIFISHHNLTNFRPPRS